jgi:hypothetical protein
MFVPRIVLLVAGITVTCAFVSAQACTAQTAAVDNYKQKIEQDKRAIKSLGVS